MNAEIIGYIASVLVAVSLTMSSILRLRVLNLVGAVVFTVYGLMIGALPVAAVNTFIVFVNVYYLNRILRGGETFRILEVGHDAEYLRYFIEQNRDDIARYMPRFEEPAAGDLAFFVLRGVRPAGLFVGTPAAGGILQVRLDYVLPDFRDFKVGSFLFREHAPYFRERGIRRLVASGETRRHAGYLRRMGFVQDSSEPTLYSRSLETHR